jgi:putative transcriptional regulator
VVWPVDIAATRRRLGLSQTEFATWFGISPGTLRNWEQGRCVPEGAGARAAAGDRARPGAVRRAIG